MDNGLGGGEELRLYLLFGSAASSWLERNTWITLSSPATSSSKKWLKGGCVARRLFIFGVHVDDHFIPHGVSLIPNIVTDCVGELSNDKCFHDGPHVAGTGL